MISRNAQLPSCWLWRAGASRVLNRLGTATDEIPLPQAGPSREWVEVALVRCDRCHQVQQRQSRWSATVRFEWMPGGWFLVDRWHIPIPESPSGTAVIGWDEGRATLLQHYFDSRGVARVYEMRLEDGVRKLTRTEPDFSPLDFAQRFTGQA